MVSPGWAHPTMMFRLIWPVTVLIRLSRRDKAPGQRECDEAIDVLNRCIREVDQASLAAISQQLAPREGISQEVSGGQRPFLEPLLASSAFTQGFGSPPCVFSILPAECWIEQPCSRLCVPAVSVSEGQSRAVLLLVTQPLEPELVV